MDNNKFNQPKPPKSAEKFLLWFLRDDLAEEVTGDMEEKFYSDLKEKTAFRARMNYWRQVFNYLRPFALKNSTINKLNHYTMYKSYFKIGWRNLLKNKGYSLINIGGLAVGMAVAVFIGLWIHNELSFNKYHENYDQLVKVYRIERAGGSTEVSDVQPTGLGTLLQTEYEDLFKNVVLVRRIIEERVIASGDKKFTEEGYFMQAEGPTIFTLKMADGSVEGYKENTILLSESLSKRLFGDADPINQIIKMDANADLTVTGVYEDLPKNSEFHGADFFAPLNIFLNGASLTAWDNFNMHIYAQLHSGAKPETISAAIRDAMRPYVDTTSSAKAPELFLHPMEKWHLSSEFKDGVNVTSEHLKLVWLFGLVGVFVLLLACINFMNLSTVQAEKRAKEIGIRKATGSLRGQLIGQFLSESLLYVFIAFVLALILVQLLLPSFNEIAGKEISILWENPYFWTVCLSFPILTGLISGSYPAIFLSSFSPLKALKGGLFQNSASNPRKVLIVFQFTVSIVLIIGTIVIYQQLQHGKNRSVGYSRDGLITLRPGSPEYFGKFETLKNELKKTGVVAEIGSSNYPITTTLGNNDNFMWRGKDDGYNPTFNVNRVTAEYGKAIRWEFIEGRDFSRDLSSDLNGVVINESASKILGLENPVGEVIVSDFGMDGRVEYTILGVVKDMVKDSPFQSTKASLIFLSENEERWLFIRIHPKVNVQEALPKIAEAYNKVIPSAPFDYKFVDAEYDEKFRAEERTGKLASIFAVLAIFISCLGLLGLVSFVARQRIKEIGIRKILGASVTNLCGLLAQDFVILVMAAFFIAVPISYYFLDGWLQQYEYRVGITWWVFAAAGLGALVIVLLTVSFQAVKAAMMNPAKSLRSE